MNTYWGVEEELHAFLNLALYGGQGLASRPRRFKSGERAPGTHWTVGWEGLRAGLDAVAKIQGALLALFHLRPYNVLGALYSSSP
jgi:hypothetical protein